MKTNIPLLDLKAQYASIESEVKSAVNQVLESQYFIMGPEVKSFEKEVAAYCDSEFAYGCASGSDALLLALMAIDIQPGDYVITSPFTFFATAGAIARLNAIPIFIDIQPDSFNINPVKLRRFLEGKDALSKKLDIDRKRIKAIIPVHLYGQMAEMDPIVDLAKEFDLKIIEDAAQSIGSVYEGKQAGTIGDFGCFSFFPSKNLGGYGDAGLITVKDPELASKVDILRKHGAKPKYYHSYVGINSRLDTIQAAVLSVKLKYLDEWSNRRRTISIKYNELFEEEGLSYSIEKCGCLSDDGCCSGGEACDLPKDKLIVPSETTGSPVRNGRHIYHQYTIRVKNRDQVSQKLKEEGIGSAVYYPVPLHIQDCFSYLGYSEMDCPASMCASKQALSLPIYPELKNEQIKSVVLAIKKILKES